MTHSYAPFPDWIRDSFSELSERVTSMTNDGGPAFPRQWATDGAVGMSLRDYFAAQLLPTLATPTADRSPEAIAAYTYLLADAMIKERAK